MMKQGNIKRPLPVGVSRCQRLFLSPISEKPSLCCTLHVAVNFSF